jgi:hypothetical protein
LDLKHGLDFYPGLILKKTNNDNDFEKTNPFAMNLLSLLHKPKVRPTLNAASPLETYVTNNLFPPDQYIREEHSHSLMKFRDRSTGKYFCLELKTCTTDWTHHIQWCTGIQLRKYLTCHKKIPTFLLLDMVNDDVQSHSYYLLSMTQACHANLIDTSIMHCKINTNEPVSSKQLWSR